MKRSLLDVLACTECKGRLAVKEVMLVDEDNNEIIDAVLMCELCSREYEVVYGVPNMLP